MKIIFALTLLLVADAFALTPSPTLLLCTRAECENADCRVPAGIHELVREKIERIEDGDFEIGRAVAAKDIKIGGAPFKLFADGRYSRNADGTAYLPGVTVQLTPEAGVLREVRTRTTRASLALSRGAIACWLE